jgi:hypothetical protein
VRNRVESSEKERAMERVRVRSDEHTVSELAQTMAGRIHDLMNGYALVNALWAFLDGGLDQEISESAPIDPAAAAAKRKLDPHQLGGLLKFLALHDVLREREGKYWLAPTGRALLSPGSLAILHLYRGGYGESMFESGALMSRKKVYGKDLVRHGKYVASGSAHFFQSFHRCAAYAALDRIGARSILDMGCGDATMLIDYCTRNPQAKGTGVDVDERAVEAAREAIAAKGLGDRVRVVLGDAFDPKVLAKVADQVDAVFSFAIQHEMFREGEQKVIDHINEIARLFAGKYYVLGEPLLNYLRDDSIFYWVHILSLQGLPRNVDGWVPLLERCKCKLEAVFMPDHERYGAYFLLKL